MGLVIGLHGAKGSGKDQFYKAVKAAFPHLKIRKIAYADPIKHEICHIFDLVDEEQYDLFKRTKVEYRLPGYLTHFVDGRRIVREIGMLMRKYDEDQFTQYVQDQIKADPEAIWCITDLRFDNELASIRQIGGIVIKIKRGGVDFDGHVTETEFDNKDCDYVIHNVDLSLEQYNQLAVKEMKKILQTIAIN